MLASLGRLCANRQANANAARCFEATSSCIRRSVDPSTGPSGNPSNAACLFTNQQAAQDDFALRVKDHAQQSGASATPASIPERSAAPVLPREAAGNPQQKQAPTPLKQVRLRHHSLQTVVLQHAISNGVPDSRYSQESQAALQLRGCPRSRSPGSCVSSLPASLCQSMDTWIVPVKRACDSSLQPMMSVSSGLGSRCISAEAKPFWVDARFFCCLHVMAGVAAVNLARRWQGQDPEYCRHSCPC